MKLLVFSDSHRSMSGMRAAVEREAPDYVIHLGDLERDAEALAGEYPRLPVAYVPGNCDGWTTTPVQKLVRYGDQQVLMSHGHLWRVKSGFDAAIAAARSAGADILLFGHTHVPYCRRLEDGLWVMNPGSILDKSSYGIISLEGEGAVCRLEQL